MKPKYSFVNNALYALNGVAHMLKNEKSFLIECVIIAPLIVLSFFLNLNILEHLLCIMVLFVILAVECINSAIEACIDLYTQEFHPLAKIAKDCGSSAVFFSICIAVMTWIVILIEAFFY